MKAEQHLYTSGKPEFITVAITEGLSREERLQLETNSLYILPTSLMYQEGVKTPVKYVYYPLREERVVVGRALYAGKDNLGRPGNYLFHNIIVQKDELFEYFASNPIALIRDLEQKGIFQDAFTEGDSLASLKLSPESPEKRRVSPVFNGHELSQLLQTCLEHRSFQLPLLLRGAEEGILDFLEQLFPLLPYDLREELSFDTYCYNTDLGFRIQGQPEAEEFRQSLAPALTLQLADRHFSVSCTLPPSSKRLELMTGMLSAGRWPELDSFHDIERDWRKQAYADFRGKYQRLSPDLQGTLLNFHRNAVLTYIVDAQDTELLRLIQKNMQVEDLDVIARSAEMLLRFVELEESGNSTLFAEWLCHGTSGNETGYPLLFQFFSLWSIFLERIAAHPEDLSILLESLEFLPQYYTPDYEFSLFDSLLTLLAFLTEEKKHGKHFLKALEQFPETNSDELLLLRTALKYELSKEGELLNSLLVRDLSVLPETRQQHVLGILLRGIFKTKNIEEMTLRLKGLFDKAENNRVSLVLLLAALETLERSKKVREILDGILKQLLQKKPSARVAESARRLLKPPPSFFQKLKDKILGEF